MGDTDCAAEPGEEGEREGDEDSRGEPLEDGEGAGERLVEGDARPEREPRGERLEDAVTFDEREAAGERLTEGVGAEEPEARAEAVPSASVPVPTGVVEREREVEALPRALALWEGLPLAEDLNIDSTPVAVMEVVAEPPRARRLVMVGVGEGGGARVKVATAVAEGAREALGASVAVAGDAEEEAVGFVAEGGAVAVTEGLPRDTEGDPEGAGVPDARALTLGEELKRSLAVAGDELGEPVSAGVREGLPEALLQGVSDREPEGEPVTRADGDALPVALSSAVAPAVGVCEEEGGGVPVAPPLALAAGLSEGELVAAEEALPPGVAEVGKVGLALAVTSGEALGEAVREAVEEADGDGLEVAEGAAVLDAAGEVDWDTLKVPEGEDRKEAKEEGERIPEAVLLTPGVAVAAKVAPGERDPAAVPETGGEKEAPGEPEAAGVGVTASDTVARAVGVTSSGVTDAAAVSVVAGVPDEMGDAEGGAEAVTEAEGFRLTDAQMVKVSVGYEGKGVKDINAEWDVERHMEGVAEAMGDREALGELRAEADRKVEAVAEGDDVVDGDAHAESSNEKDGRGDFEVVGDRDAAVVTEGEEEGAAEREEEGDGFADVVTLVLPVGAKVLFPEALTGALTEGDAEFPEALTGALKEGDAEVLALVHGRALAELDGDGGREASEEADAAPDAVPQRLPLAVGLAPTERVAPPDAVPFTTETVALVVEVPEKDEDSVRCAEGDTLIVAE